MKEMILPMKIPVLNAYSAIAHEFSILSNYENAIPWFMSNLIQISNQYSGNMETYVNFYRPHLYWDCPWIQTQAISTDIINLNEKWNGNILEFIKDSIRLGHYVRVHLNHLYIPLSGKNHNFVHDSLIYGYNDSENTLYAADNFKDRKYSFEKIGYSEFEQAYKEKRDVGSNLYTSKYILLMKYQPDAVYDFNLDHVIVQLKHYLNSTDPYKDFISGCSQADSDFSFGMEVYEKLKAYLQRIALLQTDADVRGFYFLVTHKKAMLLRLEYMENNRFLNKSLNFSMNYAEVHKLSVMLCNLLLKYNATKQKSILLKVIDGMDTFISKEIDLLTSLIEHLPEAKRPVDRIGAIN
ncbi:hypothetical protein [Cohnella cholangitidis]|uniref:Butirosin biosynthesis protein H N-terminal domain-containing protein n=1 Tax=Cohnella cholangitidis TaxID=2598458 RepID=A0A7G5BUI2_9BACL|nr:hypothetical protein [Cohnella cholangitidis]QMV40616.1 hypothetical protein FPL14_04905 [Cohnella cholangitidis]